MASALRTTARRYLLNVQPVIPVSLNAGWNLISRTIVPLVDQKDVFPVSGGQSGLGDILQSAFFSPTKPTAGGIIWSAGPVFLLPTATNSLLGGQKWGIGPTGVVLSQLFLPTPRSFECLTTSA